MAWDAYKGVAEGTNGHTRPCANPHGLDRCNNCGLGRSMWRQFPCESERKPARDLSFLLEGELPQEKSP